MIGNTESRLSLRVPLVDEFIQFVMTCLLYNTNDKTCFDMLYKINISIIVLRNKNTLCHTLW